ncbi:membrane protein [Burkholderiaceae bacterium 16]|nr:membrane protein [Burkholderiaceae bacterium 16]
MGQSGRVVGAVRGRARLSGRSKPRGFSLGSLLIVILVVGGFVIPAVRAIPSLLEYFSVKRAVSYAKQQASNKREVADYFNKQAQIDRITAVRSDDLDIHEDDNGGIRSVGFSYRNEVPLYGPLSLLITYSGTQY